jgi:anhydro-N-acetylmuramic acid kinase
MMLSIGLMSGTSMDGIDAALIETDGASVVKELGHSSMDYQIQFKILLKSAEYAARKCTGDLSEARNYFSQAINEYLKNELQLSEIAINKQIIALSAYIHGKDKSHLPITLDEVIHHSTQLHGKVVKQLLQANHYSSQQIDVVGYHGQTLFHCPALKITLQVGDGEFLAEQLGITVVNNFRQLDVAMGGQGAPFVPLYHHALALRDNKIPLAVVNCGGIANITLINSHHESDLIGFDCGPGNGLVDRLIRQRTQGRENMDRDGQYGKHGKVDKNLFTALYEHAIKTKNGKNYFDMAPPKSLDYGDLALLPALADPSLSLNNACRTLEAFTADMIVDSLKLVKPPLPQDWILAGGGWKNPVIRQEFNDRLRAKLGTSVKIQTADEAGWDSQALEAQTFAYLAVRSLQNQPISLPGTTRVPKPLSGGHAFIPAGGATQIVQKLIQSNPSLLKGYR